MVLLGPWLQTSSKWLCMNKQPMRDGALKEDAPFRKATNQMERFTEGSAKSCTLFPGSGRWGGGVHSRRTAARFRTELIISSCSKIRVFRDSSPRLASRNAPLTLSGHGWRQNSYHSTTMSSD